MKGKVIKRHFKAHIECKDIGKLTQMIQILSSKTLLTAIKEKLPKNLWFEFIHHPFVRGIADGTLPTESFVYYLKQDYLYLQHYARAAALASYKCLYIYLFLLTNVFNCYL